METTTNPEASQDSLHFLDYWRVVRTRKEIILAVTLLVALTATVYTFALPKMYQSVAKIIVRDDTADVGIFERQAGFTYNPYFLRTEYEVIKSRPILESVISNLNLRQVWGEQLNEDGQPLAVEDAYAMLYKTMRVDQFRDTSMIAISVQGREPAETARIANEVAVVYRDKRLELKQSEMRRSLDVLQNELKKQQERVALAEAEVEKIRSEYGVAMIDDRGARMDVYRLQQLEVDRINARVDMLTRKARLDEVEGLAHDELIDSVAYIVSDQALMQLRQQYLDTRVQLRLLQEEYGANHPDVMRIKGGMAELETQLADKVNGVKTGLRTDYAVAKTRYDTLTTELAEAKRQDTAFMSEAMLPFNKAQRTLEVERSILDAVRARTVQENIQKEAPRTPVTIVEPAVAPPVNRPVSPNVFLNVFLGLVLGLGAGVGLAFFIEYLDTSVKTVADVERALGLPVIGVIPQKVKFLINEGPDSPYAEAYRVLRTNLQFANKGQAGGAFAIVSGGVGEGKSTTVSNLAYVLAQMGDKVLVVDADLRRPVQHTIFGMSNRFGLSNLLMRDVPIEETIKPTKVQNLHFLPSGRLPRSSLGILDSQRMRELVKSLKARYDYVIFDSPPVVGISDASILAGEVDGVLLVVQYRKYPRIISQRAKQMLENVGGKLMGVVLNNINIMRDDYYYYYHSYYSHYYYRPEDGEHEDVLPSARESGRS